jgi:hypothetical protein
MVVQYDAKEIFLGGVDWMVGWWLVAPRKSFGVRSHEQFKSRTFILKVR